MSKETSYAGMYFRVRFVNSNGMFLFNSEWTEDRDAIIYSTDKFNSAIKRTGISVFIETKGSKHASP